MKKIVLRFFALCLGLLFVLIACKKDPIDPPATTNVSVDLTKVPYAKLSEYKFFKGALKDQNPEEDVIPYAPASSLFTDYAHKKRFVWLPQGTKAAYIADNKILELPVGAALIKTFYYDSIQPSNTSRIIETRIMIRKSDGWIFAEYVWNEEQTEATLQMDGSYTSISWSQNGSTKSSNYRIPSDVECLICHKSNSKPIPIGIKPQNLNSDYAFSFGNKNQLQHWVSLGILQNNLPPSILSVVDYKDTTQTLKTRLRSYLDINCAHCHSENSHCDYRPLRLAFSETTQSVNMGVCVAPDEIIDPSLIEIIVPGNVNKSVMHFRLNSTSEANRMPLLGRSLVDETGVQLLRDYILSISDCD